MSNLPQPLLPSECRTSKWGSNARRLFPKQE
jgi:hypothetical protein